MSYVNSNIINFSQTPALESGKYWRFDGLHTVEYKLLETKEEQLFTRFLFGINGPNDTDGVRKHFETNLNRLRQLQNQTK